MAPAALFEVIWETLVDVLGSAATATLIRRSAKIAAARHPELDGLVVERDGFDYVYAVPEAWQGANNLEAIRALRALAVELGPILTEMTGTVVVRRLSENADLRRCEIRFEEERAS